MQPFRVLSHSVGCDSLQSSGLQPARLLCPWDFPGKNSGVGCHLLLQGIFLTQGLNPHLHWQVGSLPLVPPSKFRHKELRCVLRNSWNQGRALAEAKSCWLSKGPFFYHKASMTVSLQLQGKEVSSEKKINRNEAPTPHCEASGARSCCAEGQWVASVFTQTITCTALKGSNQGFLSRAFYPPVSANSPAAQRKDCPWLWDQLLLHTSFLFQAWETPRPVLSPSRLCHSLYHTSVFLEEKYIYNKKCFTLLHCIIVRNSVLFVNAWSAISVQFGDIFKWNIKDVNDKTKRVSIFVPNILSVTGWMILYWLDHTFCAWLLNACNLKYLFFFFPLK